MPEDLVQIAAERPPDRLEEMGARLERMERDLAILLEGEFVNRLMKLKLEDGDIFLVEDLDLVHRIRQIALPFPIPRVVFLYAPGGLQKSGADELRNALAALEPDAAEEVENGGQTGG